MPNGSATVRLSRARAAFVLLAMAGCGPELDDAVPDQDNARVDLLVLAPHPDDEALIASGVIKRAVDGGKKVVVAVITNGDSNDLFCSQRNHNGYLRQQETVAAMAKLGLPESRIVFMGFPDGMLSHLKTERAEAVSRLAINGSCVIDDRTYAAYGAWHSDEHTAHHGRSAPYTAASLISVMTQMLNRMQPKDIYVTHPKDKHPDHRATYHFLRLALADLSKQPGDGFARTWFPNIHTAFVHWPPPKPSRGAGGSHPTNPSGHRRLSDWLAQFEPKPKPPPSPPIQPSQFSKPTETPSEFGQPDERVPLPPEMVSTDYQNLKLEVIGEYKSQLGDKPLSSTLMSFVRADEPFFLERFNDVQALRSSPPNN